MKDTVLPYWSNPPVHGAKIFETINSDPELQAQWYEEVRGMARRLRSLREQIVEKLAEKGSTLDWSHITKQNGMFAYTGLTQPQVLELREKYGIYFPNDGRISIASVNQKNIDYLC